MGLTTDGLVKAPMGVALTSVDDPGRHVAGVTEGREDAFPPAVTTVDVSRGTHGDGGPTHLRSLLVNMLLAGVDGPWAESARDVAAFCTQSKNLCSMY